MAEPVPDKNASSAIDENDFDDGEHGEHHPHRNSVHHQLRASSSIMQLKKLLGTLSALKRSLELPRPSNSSC
jgi:pyruvate carboxylase|tara:strand:+ start:13191 stop:13406 length:216 start_codon:yes stop_codon:yes gene_type:complete